MDPDDDNDGIPDTEDSTPKGLIDTNGDGIPDILETGVSSLSDKKAHSSLPDPGTTF